MSFFPSQQQQYPTPSPDLSPQDVVRLQLDALQNNDLLPDDAGIRAAFAFTSPTNREATGPVERFIQLVKNPLYRPLIGFETARLSDMAIVGNRAQQMVAVIHTRGGESAEFIFTLSRQTEGQFNGCWMVDGVLRTE